jgi:4-amino-4-deoxy-L-arabinose transferase-like glycosyltransferase
MPPANPNSHHPSSPILHPSSFILHPYLWLSLILLLYLALGVAYSLIVPLSEAPDEADHYLYVRHLLEQRAFPVMHPIAAENETMEANQPPLFYLLNAAVNAPFPLEADAEFPQNACYSFTPREGRAHFYLHSQAEAFPLTGPLRPYHLSRLLSVLLGAGTVLLAFVLGRQLAPEAWGERQRPFVGVLAAGLLAFNPQFLFMMASVNNDVLMALVGAAIVAGSVRLVQRPSGWGFALLGVLVGLGLLTKFALLAFWPLALLSALLVAFRNRQSAIRNFVLVLGLPLLVAGWWYVRAYRLYGDPLAWDVHLQAKGSEVLRVGAFGLADLREFALIHFQSYWGWFGWLKLPLPGWVYGLIALLVAVALVGVAVRIADWEWRIADWRRLPGSVVALGFNGLAVTAVYISLLRYVQTINWSGYQGRLAFAAAASIAALLALGLAVVGNRLSVIGYRLSVGGNRVRLTHHALRITFYAFPLIVLFTLALGSLLFIIRPAYERPALYQPSADEAWVCAVVGGLLVETAPVVDGSARPGFAVALRPSLYASAPISNTRLTMQLVGRDGAVIGESAMRVEARPSGLFAPTFVLPIDEAARPVRGILRLSNGNETADLTALVVRPVRPYAADPEYPMTPANFGGVLTLLGYDLEPEGITLYWRAEAEMAHDYTTFVHLLDADGNLLAQADGQPQDGWYPTSVWQVGEEVADGKRMVWPEERPYTIVVGAYLLETGERLPLQPPLAGDGLVIGP